MWRAVILCISCSVCLNLVGNNKDFEMEMGKAQRAVLHDQHVKLPHTQTTSN